MHLIPRSPEPTETPGGLSLPPTLQDLQRRLEAVDKELALLKSTWGKLGDAIEKYGPKLEKLIDGFGVKLPKEIKDALPGNPGESAPADGDPKPVAKKKGRFGW